MDTGFTPFMRDLERRFQVATKLQSRSHYKIFYGQIRPAPILILGINPGGDPSKTSADGLTHPGEKEEKASASAGYFEGGRRGVAAVGRSRAPHRATLAECSNPTAGRTRGSDARRWWRDECGRKRLRAEVEGGYRTAACAQRDIPARSAGGLCIFTRKPRRPHPTTVGCLTDGLRRAIQ